jgi:hypothetical protein
MEGMMRRTIAISVTAAVVCAASLAAADNEANAHSTRQELQTLAQYPKPVREAILELLTHPAVLKKVEGESAGLKKALKGESASVREAAHLMAKNPDVLKLLKDHPGALALAAGAYAKDKKKTIALMDQEETDNETSADDWAKRLEADQEAVEQLRKAADAYAKETPKSVAAAGITPADAAVTVHSHPTPKFVRYVMDNAHHYPALSNVMTSQWLSSKNPASYDRAFHHWWGQHENHFHHHLLRPDADRHHRLAELARFNHAHAHVAAQHRYANFHKHAKDYKHLAALPKHDPKNHTARLGPHHKPDHKDSHAAGKGPKKPGNGKAHHHVHRKKGSHDHHMHHAKAGHHHHAQHHAAHHGGKKK